MFSSDTTPPFLTNTCGSHLAASFGKTEILDNYKHSKEPSIPVSTFPVSAWTHNHKQPVSSALLNEPNNAGCLCSCSSENVRKM